MAILDWIYPKKCLGCGVFGSYLCQRCQREIKRRGEGLRYEGIVRQAIKEIKYRGTYDLVAELVSIWNPQKPPGEVLVTAVPMWAGKRRKRGYNQAELIGREVAQIWGVGYQELLVRNRDTKPMYGLKKGERQKNVTGAFFINPKFEIINTEKILNYKLEIRNKTVVLIDDVRTSGATISECVSVLRRAGWKKVICMALAS